MVLYSDRTFHFPRRPRPYCKVSPRHPSARKMFLLKHFWSPQFLCDDISIWQPFFALTTFLTCFQIKLTPWQSCTWGLLSAPNVWKIDLYLNIVIVIYLFFLIAETKFFFLFASSTLPDRDWCMVCYVFLVKIYHASWLFTWERGRGRENRVFTGVTESPSQWAYNNIVIL